MPKAKRLSIVAITLLLLFTFIPAFSFGEVIAKDEQKLEEQTEETSKKLEVFNEEEEESDVEEAKNVPDEEKEAELEKEEKPVKEEKEEDTPKIKEESSTNSSAAEKTVDEADSITTLQAITTPGQYETETDSIVVPAKVEGVSTNSHTLTEMIWAKGNTVYFAVKSTHPMEHVVLNGVQSTNFDQYGPRISIYVDGTEYKPTGLQGNTQDSHWSIFKFNLSDLMFDDSGKYPFYAKSGKGRGHDIRGDIIIDLPKTKVTAKKKWIGGTERPDITLQLVASTNDTSHVMKSGVVNGSEHPAWEYTWSKVPKYDPYGRPYTFTADEAEIPANYDKGINQLTVTNRYNPKTISIDVTKEWIGPKKDSATFKLYKDGKKTSKSLTVTGPDWKGSFDDLKKYDDITGDEIIYDVKEVSIPGYSSVKSGSVEEGFVFTNTNDEVINVPISKKWIGPAADAVQIKLFKQNESDPIREMTLNEHVNWEGVFDDLRKYDETTGESIAYQVEEVPIDGYSSVKTGSIEGGFTFTNTNNTLIDIPVEKRWVGGKQEQSVMLYLKGDGQDTGKRLKLSEENNWQGSFEDVRKYDKTTGQAIEYTVEEDVPEHYEVDYHSEDGVLIVTNRARYGSLTVHKVDKKGKPLSGASFELVGPNDFKKEIVTPTEGTITFDNLEWGTYTLRETKAPEGYHLLTKDVEVVISEDNLHVEETIENTKQAWKIPDTGGFGIGYFYAIGFMLMVGSTLVYFFRRYVLLK